MLDVQQIYLRMEVSREYVLADGTTCWTLRRAGDEADAQVATMIATKVDFIDCLRMVPPGMVLEFGVASGKSLREIARHSAGRVYGFDCWKGLPHDWDEGDPKGSFACAKPEVPDNVILVDGLFSDTLEAFLRDHDGPVGFCHIDCDLYCAARYVLDCLCDRFVVGSVVMFDEIAQDPNHGERLAFSRYRERNPNQHWELIGKQHPWGEVYRLLAL